MKEWKLLTNRNPVCHRIRRLLDEFLSQELSVESSQEILNHLESCAACRKEKRERLRLRAQLKAEWNALAAPAELKPRIVRGIESPLRRFSSASLLKVAAAALIPLLAFLVYATLLHDPNDSPLRAGRAVNHFHLAASDHEDCRGIPIEGKGVLEAALPELERLLNGTRGQFRFMMAGECHIEDARFVHYVFAGPSGRRFSLFLEQRGPDEHLPPELLLRNVSGVPLYGTPGERHTVVCLQGTEYYVYLVGDDFGEAEMRELAGKLAPPLQATVL